MQIKVPFMKRNFHALSWLAHGISPTFFDPMVLVSGIASKSVDLMHFHDWFMVLVQQFFDPMVLDRGIVEGPRLYKRKKIIWQSIIE